MDRFIEMSVVTPFPIDQNLKSSMDRFIAFEAAMSKVSAIRFKIQYG